MESDHPFVASNVAASALRISDSRGHLKSMSSIYPDSNKKENLVNTFDNIMKKK